MSTEVESSEPVSSNNIVRPFPAVEHDSPSVAAWRATVEAYLRDTSEDISEIKAMLQDRGKFSEQCWSTLNKISESGNLKWVAAIILGLALLGVIAVAAPNLALSYGDLTVTTDGTRSEALESARD